MADTVQRKIYFYRMKVTPDQNGNTQTFSPKDACSAISHLRFLDNTGSSSRYLVGDRAEEVICVWPKTHVGKIRLSIGTCRRGALPNFEEMGEVSPVDATGRKGVLDETHVAFFSHGIVGAEFNFHGPRLSKLAAYLALKCPQLPRVEFVPLFNKDTQQKLERLEDVHLLQLRLRKSDLGLLQQASPHFPAALQATSEQFDVPVIEVCLRPAAGSRKALGTQVLELVKTLVGMPSVLERAERFRVRGTSDLTNRLEWFDFLAEKLFFTQQVVKQQRHRAVDPTDMFSKIEVVYNQHQQELQEAAGVEE